MAQLGIIGAGSGGANLLKTFLSTPNIHVIGIADPNPHSPGIVYAKKNRVYTTANFQDLFQKPGKKILFDATGVQAVAEQLAALATEDTVVISPDVAKLFWEIVDTKEEINKTLIQESDSLLNFIEEGLEHIETLNSSHGEALEKAVTDIQILSQLTTESQTLVQETTKIMHLIKNVADQTRILGINASIESARAGDYGRGFGVVANSIHELSASSLKSVNSVSSTMESIRQVLLTIDQKVDQVVTEMQKIKDNQGVLTQELHSSLEEMVRSAERLGVIAGKQNEQK